MLVSPLGNGYSYGYSCSYHCHCNNRQGHALGSGLALVGAPGYVASFDTGKSSRLRLHLRLQLQLQLSLQ